jgi:GNAT superfamily N-acetyltransferase
MKIIQVTLEHLDDLIPLFDAYRVWYNKPSNVLKTRQFLTERILQHESIIFLVYTEGGQAAGFTQLYPVYSSVRLGRMWLLNDLFVAEEHRGNGFSIALIERAKDMARKTGAVGVVLETDKTNDVGNKLYPRTGFELSNKTQNYYGWYNPEFEI